MNKQTLVNHIKAASRSIKCDLVIKNVTIIDVFNKDRFIDNVAIKDGYIVGIGEYDGNEIIDGTNKHICPGLIDSHCHKESSLVTPTEYYKVALLNGITSVIADPHEISNVMGTDGLNFMIEASNKIPFDVYFMLPSCVPIIAPNINFNPFLTLSFLSLPVIPTLKITDKGLFDVVNFRFIDICE